MFNKTLFLNLKISKFQSRHYRYISTDPLGSIRGSQGSAEHTLGTTDLDKQDSIYLMHLSSNNTYVT